MKKDTHPKYAVTEIKCSNCDTVFSVGSTSAKSFNVGICSQCHPVYTGKTTIIDSANRVSKFFERQKRSEEMKTKKTSK